MCDSGGTMMSSSVSGFNNILMVDGKLVTWCIHLMGVGRLQLILLVID